MGLDIIAYEKVERVGPVDPELEPEEGTVHLEPNDAFLSVAEGLTAGVYRVGERSHEFRAGSYSYYNAWREDLARLIGTTSTALVAGGSPTSFAELARRFFGLGKPAKALPTAFRELILFSDCEGTIGPATSRKLAADFAEWESHAMAFADALGERADGFRSVYLDFKTAFEVASNDGAVQFC